METAVGAAGNTPMGAAFDLVVKMVEDHAQIPSRAYRPTVVLVSDGQPNDEWREPLQRLLASDRASKASRFVLGIGDDACEACHKQFKPGLTSMGIYKSPNYPAKN